MFAKDEIINLENSILTGEILDSKKIHQFYQLIKSQKLAKLSTFASPEVIEWNLLKHILSEKEAVYLGKFKGIECYTIAVFKIGETYDILSKALEKGFVSR